MTERDLTLDSDHTMRYTDAALYKCTLETYVILLTNIASINSIKNLKNS